MGAAPGAIASASPRPASVPDLAGVPRSEADSILLSAGLGLGHVGESREGTSPAGTIISQRPAPGDLARTGSSVDVTVSAPPRQTPSSSLALKRIKRLTGAFSPKSVVATQHGLVLAQNMIYRHTISVFDDTRIKLVRTIQDKVRLSDFGYTGHPGTVRGGPVEAAITPDGKYAYVSNYSMYGAGFSHPGHDAGGPGSGFDKSFVYRIPLDTLAVDKVIKVGSVPKFLAVSPDGRYLLVSNWISYTVSVIDTATNRQIRQIKVGRFPRGIAINARSTTAYIAVMGSTAIAKLDMRTFRLRWIRGVGLSPRHLILSPRGDFLYATLNGSGKVAKIRVSTGKVVKRATAGRQPRSMTIAEDGLSLYVVNYESSTVSKIRTSDMHVIQTVTTDIHPIGITYVNRTHQVWVSCYRGSILVFRDR